MEIVIAQPPMFEEIDRVFRVRGKAVVFCWGAKIYNPMGLYIHPEIMAHEGVHSSRQLQVSKGDHQEELVVAWWKRYLEDPEFRLMEELPAHRAEYRALINRMKDRNRRSAFLQHVAEKLAAPLYGGIITKREAIRRIAA